MMNHIKTQLWIKIIGGFVCIWIVLAAVFPDQLITQSTRFMNVMDTEIPYENTFTIAGQLARGHVNLFNPFDGFSYAYAHLTNGVYTLGNILTAIGYVLTAGLVQDQAKYFHHFYSIMFFTVNSLLLYLGGFLLAGLFTQRIWVKILALVYLNVVFAQFLMNNGLMVSTLIGYLPLLMYVLIRAWQELTVIHCVKAIVMLTLCIANAPLCGLAFFYQAIHGLILMLAGSLIVFRFKTFLASVSLIGSAAWWVKHRTCLIFGAIAVVILMLPNLLWLKSLSHDFYVANSGLGGTEGRLGNLFNIHTYFTSADRSIVDPKAFIVGSLDYSYPAWGWSWPFISAGAMWFIVYGLIFSRSVLAWIFLAAFLWVFSLNFPAEQWSVLSWAHWLNVLTNPFQFLVRSVHMADLVSIFFLWPPLVIGVDAFVSLLNREQWALHRLNIALSIMIVVIVSIACICPTGVREYVLISGGVFAFALGLNYFKRPMKICVVFALLLVVFFDLKALSHYVVGDLMKDRHLVELDYQNPMVLPWRDFYRTDPTPLTPPRNGYLNSYGFFYGFAPYIERYSRRSSMYEPRHLIFKGLEEDREGLTYLSRDGRMMYLADDAVDETTVSWTKILEAGMDRKVVITESRARETGRVNVPQAVTINSSPEMLKEWSIDLPIVREKIRLPFSFDPYFVSSAFTPEQQMWKLSIDGKEINANINDRRQGEVIADLSMHPYALTAQFKRVRPDFIEQIHRWNGDELIATINAKRSGWVVIHWPYDQNWKVTLNQKDQSVYRVNRYFLGFPVEAGQHRMSVMYKPYHPMRFLIVLMCIMMILVYVYLINDGFKQLMKVNEHAA